MAPEKMANALADVFEAKRDPEAAHILEDELWRAALRSIAEGCEDPASVAKAALLTETVDFPRWYA